MLTADLRRPVFALASYAAAGHAQTVFFSLADSRDCASLARDKLPRENLHALRAIGFNNKVLIQTI